MFNIADPRNRTREATGMTDSIEAERTPLTPKQAAELDRRYATLDEDIKHGLTAAQSIELLERRYR